MSLVPRIYPSSLHRIGGSIAIKTLPRPRSQPLQLCLPSFRRNQTLYLRSENGLAGPTIEIGLELVPNHNPSVNPSRYMFRRCFSKRENCCGKRIESEMEVFDFVSSRTVLVDSP